MSEKLKIDEYATDSTALLERVEGERPLSHTGSYATKDSDTTMLRLAQNTPNLRKSTVQAVEAAVEEKS